MSISDLRNRRSSGGRGSPVRQELAACNIFGARPQSSSCPACSATCERSPLVRIRAADRSALGLLLWENTLPAQPAHRHSAQNHNVLKRVSRAPTLSDSVFTVPFSQGSLPTTDERMVGEQRGNWSSEKTCLVTPKQSMWIPAQNLTGHLSDFCTNRDLAPTNLQLLNRRRNLRRANAARLPISSSQE